MAHVNYDVLFLKKKIQEKAEEYYDDFLRPDVVTYTTLVKVSQQSVDLFTYLIFVGEDGLVLSVVSAMYYQFLPLIMIFYFLGIWRCEGSVITAGTIFGNEIV